MRERINHAVAFSKAQVAGWLLSLSALIVVSVAVVFGVAASIAPRPLPVTTGIANSPGNPPPRFVGGAFTNNLTSAGQSK